MPKSLMQHRISSECETSTGLSENRRQNEDRIIFERLWPKHIASILTKFYEFCYDNSPRGMNIIFRELHYLKNPETQVTVSKQDFKIGFFMLKNNRILVSAIITACLISALHIFFCFDVYDDIATCYALMTRAFADGDWYNAFALHVPVLTTSMGGFLTAWGMGPFRSLVVVSCLFYIASIPLLYYVLKYFLKRGDYAAWGCLLYVLSPKIIRFSCTGLLNPAKNFFIIAAIALILSSARRLKWSNTLLMGIVLAGLALARAETLVFLPLFVLWYAYFIFCRQES